MERQLYCGTYGQGGIYRLSLENGVFTVPELFCAISSPKYLSCTDEYIACIYQHDAGKAGVAVIDFNGTVIDCLPFEKVTSCYVGCYEDLIVTANYHEGTVSLLQYHNRQLRLISQLKIRDKAGCHQVLFHDELILVTALFDDCIYLLDHQLNITGKILFPEGSGPRHMVFSQDRKYLYVVSELSNDVFAVSTADWSIVNFINLTHEPAASAAIRLENSRLYVSVRKLDRVYEIETCGKDLKCLRDYSCRGVHPRDMIITDGQVVCANLDSGTVTLLKDGQLISEAAVPQAVSLLVLQPE